jgi:malate synthase
LVTLFCARFASLFAETAPQVFEGILIMSTPIYAAGIEIKGAITAQFAEVLTPEAMAFFAEIHRKFEPRRRELMAARVERTKRLDAGERPDFLAETKHIREGAWSVAPQPKDLLDRRVEITGPVDRKMVINALNSGAKMYMTDFEDSNCPKWEMNIAGQINLRDAINKTITLEQNGKSYKLNGEVCPLLVRPRGWHLMEKNLFIDGQMAHGGMFDFAIYFFTNAKTLIANGSGPYFYLPKMESHLEARLWNDIFVHAQTALGIKQGTIKATVLIETILAAFEMEEILYELREHSSGLNAGRWDYIFSCIKKFKVDRDFCLADRKNITMTSPFMRAYAMLLLKTCHKRGAPAIGGMSALIPNKNDPVANEKALEGVRSDKLRDATDGYDGGWVAHPGLVATAMAEFDKVLGAKPNQYEKQRPDVNVTASDLLNFAPEAPISEAGLRMNINVGIQYLGSWLGGNGCVPVHGLMEDAATAEISRSQVWQWIRTPKGKLDDGRKVDAAMVNALIPQELEMIRKEKGDAVFNATPYAEAAKMFGPMCTGDEFVEFLTLPAYDRI